MPINIGTLAVASIALKELEVTPQQLVAYEIATNIIRTADEDGQAVAYVWEHVRSTIESRNKAEDKAQELSERIFLILDAMGVLK